MTGTIDTIHFSLGDTVEKGDLLAELDHDKIDSQIESLEKKIASLKESVETENTRYNAQIDELNAKKSKLLSGETASKNPKGEAAVIDSEIKIYEARIAQNISNLEDDLTVPQEQLDKLLESYPDYFIYAPMSGEVVFATTSRQPEKNATIIAVADFNTKYIQAEASSENYIYNAHDVYALHNGKRYDIMHVPTIYDTTCENLLSAKGKFSNYLINGSMDNFNYGDYVLICIDTTYIKDALSVPNTALYRDSSGTYVYLVSDAGVRTRQNIVTSITDSINTVVVDGLEEGDIIYVPN